MRTRKLTLARLLAYTNPSRVVRLLISSLLSIIHCLAVGVRVLRHEVLEERRIVGGVERLGTGWGIADLSAVGSIPRSSLGRVVCYFLAEFSMGLIVLNKRFLGGLAWSGCVASVFLWQGACSAV